MFKRTILLLIQILTLSLGLAWISSGFESIQGWGSFGAVSLLGTGILLAGWWALKSDPVLCQENAGKASPNLPAWLGGLLTGAALLRLSAGILWFVALPAFGYGGEVERAGYVMSDAHRRDSAAWQLAQSDQSLNAAFTAYHAADQYGGLLFLSALTYRYVGGAVHQPLQILVLTASFSALAVVFSWGFVRRLWNERTAALAAWIVALFPDAILLGSSQMREALMMSLVMMAFYGLLCAWQDRSRRGLAWLLLPVLVGIPLSPPFALMLAVFLVVFAFFMSAQNGLKSWQVWAALAVVLGAGLIFILLLGDKLLPGNTANPIALVQGWLKQAARWQAYNSEHASGWMQKIFRSTPDWLHTWLLLAYGVVRPFLPAALFDPGASIWQGISIWRSLGWTLLLPFMIVAPFITRRRDGWHSPALGLSILVWTGILIAAFRGGGDAWDNPRYRVTWIGLQAALAAWVWGVQKRDRSPVLRRVLVATGLIFLWFVPWYLDRMTAFEWLTKDVFLTVTLGVVSALAYWIFDVWRLKRLTKNR